MVGWGVVAIYWCTVPQPGTGMHLRIEMQIFSLHSRMHNISLFNVCKAQRRVCSPKINALFTSSPKPWPGRSNNWLTVYQRLKLDLRSSKVRTKFKTRYCHTVNLLKIQYSRLSKCVYISAAKEPRSSENSRCLRP